MNLGIGNWDEEGNWSLGWLPEAVFDEVAVVTNGGTAIVDTPVSEQAGGVLLGKSAGQTGTLEIRSGGNLTVVAGTGSVDGSVTVGDAGTGLLELAGGSLNSISLASGGETNSTITLTGTATLVTGSATLGRRTRVIGPNVSFFAAGDVQFTNTSILIAEITGPLHSALGVTGTATLDGKLEVAFNGYTPTTKDTWNLIDASVIDGSFDGIEVIGSSALGPDQELAVRTVAGGNNGSVAQLHVTVSPHILTRSASDSGHYSPVGYHNPTDTSYEAAVGGSRSFFVFDLSDLNVPDPIVSATLELEVGLVTGGTFGGADYTLYEVTTPTATLVAGGSDLIGVHGDLGDGPAYSAVTWIDPEDAGTTKSIPLLSAGAAAVNAAKGGQIAMGGFASGSGGHFAFGGTDVTGAKLVVELGWPAPYITDSLLVGAQFTLRFTGEPGVTNWQVMGSHDLPVFGEDKTTDSTISETSPGVYQAVVEIDSRTNRYFMRIAR